MNDTRLCQQAGGSSRRQELAVISTRSLYDHGAYGWEHVDIGEPMYARQL